MRHELSKEEIAQYRRDGFVDNFLTFVELVFWHEAHIDNQFHKNNI